VVLLNRTKPKPADLEAAKKRRVPDVIASGLDVLFCGINPGLYTAWIGHHFGRPGNRFWPAMHAGGFTPILLPPYDEKRLLEWNLGITNMVARPTNLAAELTDGELLAGRTIIEQKVDRYQPHWLAMLGVTSFRIAFNQPKAMLGRQSLRLGRTNIWVLPNPSGLNAHHTPTRLAELFREFYHQVYPDKSDLL
jgi:TDG/mug DNA glycosylase family protein